MGKEISDERPVTSEEQGAVETVEEAQSFSGWSRKVTKRHKIEAGQSGEREIFRVFL
jgi:hypothetical protein